ncbi:MAG: hypothetical protein ABSF92_04130 [Candidatus Acidiferrales bacterium]|jgi:hypothetical protein
MSIRSVLAFTAISTLLVTPVCLAQAQFDKVQYLKPPAAGQKKAEPVDGSLTFDAAKKELRFVGKGTPDLTIKYDSVKSMLYEKASKPRYAEGILLAWPLLLTKSKKHYFTIQYSDAAGTGQYALLRLDKSNYREVLAKAEADTGKKVDRSEEH